MDNTKMKLAILCCMFMTLVGCSVDKEAITDVREYSIDGYLTIVGVGTHEGDTFHIVDYRGQKWDIPTTADIREGAISLQSFDRARQRITPQDVK